MHKQRFQSGHAKRKAKQKEASIACEKDKSQKKFAFSQLLDKVRIKFKIMVYLTLLLLISIILNI